MRLPTLLVGAAALLFLIVGPVPIPRAFADDVDICANQAGDAAIAACARAIS